MNPSRFIFPLAALAVAVLLTACSKPAPTSYRIPKEERKPAEFAIPGSEGTSPVATQASAPSGMQVLPGMAEAAEAAGEISYTVPEGWTELAPEGIRKANLRVQDEKGSAEVTVLVFPGTVGGVAANINRWRQQIGLAPVAASDPAAVGTERPIAGHGARFVRIEGSPQSILGAILPFHGETWFFKMQGDSATVLDEEAAMLQFLDSVRMVDHAH